MERDIPRNELTGQGMGAYSNSRGINMSDGPGAGENSPVNLSGDGAPKAGTGEVQQGFFSDSDLSDPSTRESLGIIRDDESVPEEVRREASERLEEVRDEISEFTSDDDKEVKEEKKKPEFGDVKSGDAPEHLRGVFKLTNEPQVLPPGISLDDLPPDTQKSGTIDSGFKVWRDGPEMEYPYTKRKDEEITEPKGVRPRSSATKKKESSAKDSESESKIWDDAKAPLEEPTTPPSTESGGGSEPPEDPPAPPSEAAVPGDEEHEDGARTDGKSESTDEESDSSEEDMDEEGRESKRFAKDLLKHLSNEDVQRQLRSENPEFTSLKGHELGKGVDEFREFIEKIVPGGDLITFANVISRKNIKIGDKSIHLSDASRMLLFEWAMNRIITIPNADEDSHYDLSLELTNYRDRLKAMAQSNFSGKEYKDFHARISGIASVEQTFHNVRIAIAAGNERYQELFASLRTPSLNFINNDLAGVSQVINEFERSFLLEASKSTTALRTTQTEVAVKRARKAIEKLYEKGNLKDGDRVVNRWEMERALRLGETFFRASQRGAVYTTVGDTTGITESFYDEYAARQMAPAKMTWWRFWYPEAHGKPATRKLLDRTINNMKRQWDEKTKEQSKNKSSLGQSQVEDIDSLMGQSREEMFKNYLGVFDIASHSSVRGPKLFLSPIKMENGTEEGVTMYDFLYGKSMKKIQNQAELDEIETRVLGQTSYLSALNRHSALSTELRTKIWRKRAVIDPLAVASLRPEILKDMSVEQKAAWDKLTPLLDEYHIMKLNDEKLKYGREKPITNKEMEDEAAKFRGDRIESDVRDEILNSEYFQEIINAVDDEGNPVYSEKEKKDMVKVFKVVVDRGIGQAEYLAKTTSGTRHMYAIDDAPIVAWYEESGQGLNDNNFVRNYSDQANLAEKGFNPLTPIVDDPKLAINGEAFDNAVKGFAQVIGDDPARELVEGMMMGWLQMAKQYEKTKWLPTFSSERGKAMSELEETFGNLGVHWGETDIKQWLEGRAFKGTIENELSKDRGKRRLNQLKDEMRSGRLGIAIEKIREDILKIAPFIVAITFFTAIWRIIKEGVEGGIRENV